MEVKQAGRCGRVSATGTLRLAVAGVALGLVLSAPAIGAIAAGQFVEARGPGGALALQDEGETWGASWGDLDGDGFPDLWLGKHQYTPAVLMRNNGDGSFSNVIDSAAPLHLDHLRDDTHGAAWADFDGDGDEDLLEVSGGGAGSAGTGTLLDNNYNNLWVNSGGVLSEQAQAYGLDYPYGRSRTPAWLDYDRDGALDVVISAFQSLPTDYPSAIFHQTFAGTFEDRTAATGFAAGSCYFGMLSDLSGDGEHDLVCADASRVQAIYDIAAIPFSDLRPDLGEDLYSIYPGDLVIGDFNGDLAPDVFTSRVPPNPAAAVQVGSERIHASLPASALEQGFSFAASGDVRIEFGWETERAEIFLGSGAVAPPVDSDPGLIEPDSRPHHVQLVLAPAEPHLGLPPSNERTGGIYIGLDGGRWQVRAVNVGAAVEVVVQAASVSALQAVGAVALDQGSTGVPMLFVNQGGVLVRSATAAVFLDPTAAISSYMRSFVAGDFDNDMDLDVYVGASGRVANVDNLLFDNQGDGTFRLAASAGGAGGSLLGATDSVTTVDYDRDGFLDLFVTQGNFPAPVAYSGVQQLFRNQGNPNHWIELDLEGTASNPHGIGATVLARTADGKVQLREQGNGMHRFSQSHRRIHFGLGPNRQVDIEVRWPSGVVDYFADLGVDQLHRLVEATGNDQGVSGCGAPTYDPATDGGLYLWEENCGNATRSFTVRAAGGGSASTVTYAGQVDANRAFSVVTPFSLESTDVLVNSGSQIVYELNVRDRYQDGFGFSIASAANVCFGLDLPAGTRVLVGPNATPVAAPFDLTTYQSCGAPPPTTDICGAPTYDPATDGGLYLWEENCGNATRSFTVRAAGGGSASTVTYAGQVDANRAFSVVTPFSLESTDVLVNSGSQIVYEMNVRNIYQDGFGFSIASAANVCFGLDLPAGTRVLVGPNATPVAAPFDLTTYQACAAPPVAEICGAPTYDPASDAGLYLWEENCGGATRDYLVRATAGGSTTTLTYAGRATASAPFVSVTPFSLESTDALTSTRLQIDYSLLVRRAYEDGFGFSAPDGASVCFGLDLPAGTPVRVGPNGAPVAAPFSLPDLGACTP